MRRWFGAVLMAGLVAATAAAQIHGVPPSVTSIGTGPTPLTPGVPASVTSLGPAGFTGGHLTQLPPQMPHDRIPRFVTPVFFPWYSNYTPAPQPVVVVVEQPAPVVVTPERESEDRPPELIILERDGDRYVRRNYSRVEPARNEDEGEDAAAARRSRRADSDRPSARRKPAADLRSAPRDTEEQPAELQPAVLVFLDGKRSEVTNFAIVGPVLYDLSDRRSRKIQLAELDLPATIAANDERGIAFRLPPASSPNQVITRP